MHWNASGRFRSKMQDVFEEEEEEEEEEEMEEEEEKEEEEKLENIKEKMRN